MLTKKELEEMKNMDIKEAEEKELINLEDIQIDMNKNPEERMKDFIEQIKNPYLFRVGDYTVKVSFSDCGVSLEERIEEYLMRLQEDKLL